MSREYHSRGAWAALLAGLAVTYAATSILCVSISAVVANVSWMLYIPAGLSFSSALLWGPRVWPAVAIGEFVMALWSGEPMLTAVLMAVANSVDTALVGWWFHDRLKRRLELDRIQDVVHLIGADLLIFQPLCTALGMVSLIIGSRLPWHYVPESAAAWYSSNLYAELLAAPIVLAWLRWPRLTTSRAGAIELGILGVLTLLVGAIGPGRWSLPAIPLSLSLVLSFPLLAWAASRFVPTVALTAGGIIGMFACDAALAGLGPFEHYGMKDTMINLNFFMMIMIGTSLFLTAAVANERRQEAEQAELITRLQAADTKVSRLQEIVTLCAWTGRVRVNDDWISVEKFLHDRYNLNITHGISDEAMQRIMADAVAASKSGWPGGRPPGKTG